LSLFTGIAFNFPTKAGFKLAIAHSMRFEKGLGQKSIKKRKFGLGPNKFSTRGMF
ncbi:unnamed protein product, partial [marine sediment metagenome]